VILLDPRMGQHQGHVYDYEPLLRSLGAPVEMCHLDFADAAWYGSGLAIGVEIKRLNDLLNAITNGRFSGHQLPGLCRDYNEAYLIVEGFWRPNPHDGVLETRRGREWVPVKLGKRTWMYRDLDNFLTTIEVKGGVRVKRTAGPDETARIIYGLYNWWADVDSHRSHLALNRAGRDAALFTRPTFVRRVAAELPGIGYERSGEIAASFPTVRAMIAADTAAWLEIDGIGKKIAKGIVEAWDSRA
jgi:ERCC4-type nuclease